MTDSLTDFCVCMMKSTFVVLSMAWSKIVTQICEVFQTARGVRCYVAIAKAQP